MIGKNAKIQNNSPCFTVAASHTILTTEDMATGVCVPTGGSHGIVVNAGLEDVRIIGIEFDGTGQVTGDGIHFNGAITDFQIVDNYFHDLDGSGIEFGGTITNNLGIQGNLFKNNFDVAIAATVPVDAQFNNWNSKTVITLANVDTSNWTFADLSLVSSGTPWTNQVVSGQTISYAVKANLQNVKGAEFTLNFPANLAYTSSTPGAIFDNEYVTAGAGTLLFKLYNLASAAESGDNVTLFTVTFTANATGSANLTFDAATDKFSMVPTSEISPSTNVYANSLTNGTVNVITLPTLTWVDAFPTYAAGIPQAFTLTVTNGTGGTFTPVLSFTGTGITVGGNTTVSTLASGESTVLNLTITFANPGAQSVVVNLTDPAATPATTVLATLTHDVTVNANFTVTGTISMQGRTFRGGVPVLLTNLGLEPYGPFPGTSTNVLGNNLLITNVAQANYSFITDQDRYLDVIAANNKSIAITGNKTITALELKGGDANDDNEIEVGDAGIIGGVYGQSGNLQADVNYSGKVDIFDLALVGGNYGLTSVTAYGIGDLIWIP
jgi:hypothetical protein